jgi:hypothetical protein
VKATIEELVMGSFLVHSQTIILVSPLSIMRPELPQNVIFVSPEHQHSSGVTKKLFTIAVVITGGIMCLLDDKDPSAPKQQDMNPAPIIINTGEVNRIMREQERKKRGGQEEAHSW